MYVLRGLFCVNFTESSNRPRLMNKRLKSFVWSVSNVNSLFLIRIPTNSLLIVRETLTQDLIERLVVDILEVAESLMCTCLWESL